MSDKLKKILKNVGKLYWEKSDMFFNWSDEVKNNLK